MQSKATSIENYLEEIPKVRLAGFKKLRAVVKKNLPKGFKEMMCYGSIGFVVPHSKYPKGYHCNPEQPLPFMNLASQKNYIAVYHMGVYAKGELLKWFQSAHAKASPKKLDMGKSCIRYKNPEDIPFELIGELASKMTPDDWISCYENAFKR